MATSFELTAQSRQAIGSGASRRLRRIDNRVPAVLYGGGEGAVSISFDHNQLLRALENEAFASHILAIHIDGTTHKAVLKDIQRHPFKPRILHLDLLRITGKEKITLSIPLHFTGEAQSPGVKAGGIIQHLLTSVEIRCLPSDLPEFLTVDVSHLELDQPLTLAQIVLPAGVELIDLIQGEDRSIISLQMQKAEAEEVVAPPASAVPAINEKKENKDSK